MFYNSALKKLHPRSPFLAVDGIWDLSTKHGVLKYDLTMKDRNIFVCFCLFVFMVFFSF